MIKPILFNAEMVRAILDGRKTVTRRLVKYKYSNTEMKMHTDKYGTRIIEIQRDVEGETYGENEDGSTWHKLRGYIEPKPPYQPGDILYVRETWAKDDDDEFVYRTNYGSTEDDSFPPSLFRWRPSIHMPKAAARIWLKVTDVRVERLQDITPEEAVREGVVKRPQYARWGGKKCLVIHGRYKLEFAKPWDSTIKKSDLALYGWDANPWVWVIEFVRSEKPEET